MAASRQISEEQLNHIYELLRKALTPEEEAASQQIWYMPAMPAIDPGSRLSATDLLSWWFRPPTANKNPWDSYFAEPAPVQTPHAKPPASMPAAQSPDPLSRAAIRALVGVEQDELAYEDADRAVGAFYEFLHAVARRDVDAAMEFIAEDYHTFEDDLESDRGDIRSRIEVLLDSMHGYDLEVSLTTVPEPLLHPYGVVMPVEIQLDGVKPQSRIKRNVLNQRLVLLQRDHEDNWKIAAMSEVRS